MSCCFCCGLTPLSIDFVSTLQNTFSLMWIWPVEWLPTSHKYGFRVLGFFRVLWLQGNKKSAEVAASKQPLCYFGAISVCLVFSAQQAACACVGMQEQGKPWRQFAIYEVCLERYRHRHRWMAFFDSDEFLMIKDPAVKDLPTFLKVCCWRIAAADL